MIGLILAGAVALLLFALDVVVILAAPFVAVWVLSQAWTATPDQVGIAGVAVMLGILAGSWLAYALGLREPDTEHLITLPPSRDHETESAPGWFEAPKTTPTRRLPIEHLPPLQERSRQFPRPNGPPGLPGRYRLP